MATHLKTLNILTDSRQYFTANNVEFWSKLAIMNSVNEDFVYIARNNQNFHDFLHRTDGPAAEFADGSKFWYLNGKRHRTDGPAVEFADGTKWWYLNGKRHRIGGPAIEYADGYKAWWLNGRQYFLEDYCKELYKDEWEMYYTALSLKYE